MVRPFVCTASLCLLAACGRGDTPTTATPSGPAPDVVRVAYSEPDAGPNDDRGLGVIVGLLSDERLVGLSRDGRPEPRLAERWEVSPDGLTWRFALRRGLTFQNGQPITSAEGRAAIGLDPSTPENQTQPGLRDLVAVETPTPNEIVVRLKRPNAFLLEGLNLSPLTGSDDSGAGPFRLDAQTPGKATLVRFDRYFRGRSAVAGVTIARYPSPREAWSSLMRGDVDVLYEVTPEAFEFVKESPNAHIASYLRPYVIALTFNMAHPKLGQRAVRRALNLAVDRALVIDTVAGGRAVPAADPIWPNHWARDTAAPGFAFDPETAKAALDQAGLRKKSRTGLSSRFSFTCLVQADPRFEPLALLIQRQLIGIDVDMKLEALPVAAFQQRVASGRYDAFLGEMAASSGLGFTYMWWHSKPPSIIRTGYAGADAALDRIRSARTDGDLRSAVHDLQHRLHDDPPAVFLYWEQRSRAVSRRFALPAGDDLDILRSVDRWTIVSPGGAAPP